MESTEFFELFSTKGAEYILVILYLVILTIAWISFNRKPVPALRSIKTLGDQGWFSVPDDLFYHPGHSWLSREGKNVVRIGIDDFAQKLIGKTDEIILPKPGTVLDQGAEAWKVKVDGKTVPQLSPVTGEVVEVNENVLNSPGLLNIDPYGKAWLLKVKTTDIGRNIKNLISGEFAKAWMEKTKVMLSEAVSGELGTVLQDGGIPVNGIAKAIDPEDWEKLVRKFFITS